MSGSWPGGVFDPVRVFQAFGGQSFLVGGLSCSLVLWMHSVGSGDSRRVSAAIQVPIRKAGWCVN